MAFTFDDMTAFATEAWGPVGLVTAQQWAHFNREYFDGALAPIPLVITHTQPHGRRLAFCSHSGHGAGRTITLNLPKVGGAKGPVLVANNGVLLHEMIHQFLFERGEDAAHAGAPWRREIMRLHPLLTGVEIWAGRSRPVRFGHKVKRINEPAADGRASLPQGDIARWPYSCGIELGALGTATKAVKLKPVRIKAPSKAVNKVRVDAAWAKVSEKAARVTKKRNGKRLAKARNKRLVRDRQ